MQVLPTLAHLAHDLQVAPFLEGLCLQRVALQYNAAGQQRHLRLVLWAAAGMESGGNQVSTQNALGQLPHYRARNSREAEFELCR